MKIHFITGGYCDHPEFIVAKGGSYKARKFPALVVVIEHPKHGVILFDTGYSKDFHKHTRYMPERLYAMVTPVHISPETTALAELNRIGIQAKDVRYVILSHFHADHAGGVIDFPEAKYLYLKDAYTRLKDLSRMGRLLAGFLRACLPQDFEARSQYIEAMASTQTDWENKEFSKSYDLFGDGSLLAIELPGHAFGHIGLYVRDGELAGSKQTRDYFFISDSCWLKENFTEKRYPALIARAAMNNYGEYIHTIEKIHNFHALHPEVAIVPCHCSTTIDELTSR